MAGSPYRKWKKSLLENPEYKEQLEQNYQMILSKAPDIIEAMSKDALGGQLYTKTCTRYSGDGELIWRQIEEYKKPPNVAAGMSLLRIMVPDVEQRSVICLNAARQALVEAEVEAGLPAAQAENQRAMSAWIKEAGELQKKALITEEDLNSGMVRFLSMMIAVAKKHGIDNKVLEAINKEGQANMRLIEEGEKEGDYEDGEDEDTVDAEFSEQKEE